MKRCPECRRDYYDETLSFCLDDGAHLVDGPAFDEPKTASFAELTPESPTRSYSKNEETTTEAVNTNRNSLIAAIAGILVLVAVGVGAYLYYGRGTTKQIDSIAVMPFVNESGNPEVEYLSDGMTETLISSLSQLPSLNVKARSSVFRYKGKETDPQTIGNELKVQAILNGRVIQRSDDLILYLELVDARTGNSIWSDQYNKKLTNLISLQTEIARDVSNKLRLKLSGSDEQKLAKKYTADPEAYQLYLKGRYAWNKFTPADHKKAAEYFNQALAKDPGYALAYVGLADTYGSSATNSWILPKEGYSKAEAAGKKALAIDPTLAQAHATLGALSMFADFDWEAAEQGFKRAEELDPNAELTYELYSYLLSALGRREEAIAKARRGLELDPLSALLSEDLALAFYLARDYDQAIGQTQKTLELDPHRPFAFVWLGNAYDMNGRYDDAIAAHQKAISLAERTSVFLSPLGHAYAASGRRGEAVAILNEMKAMSQQTYVSPYDLAILYTGLGDKDNAFEQLNKAYDERSGWMIYLKVEPQFDPLRDDPRFQELVRKVGLHL